MRCALTLGKPLCLLRAQLACIICTALPLLVTPALRAQSQASCPAQHIWPTSVWTSRAETVAISRASEIRALEDYAFKLEGSDAERKGLRTDGLLIVQGGEIIYERYAREFAADKRHISWSAAKSFTSAFTGIAVGQGALGLEDSICQHLKGVPADNCSIKVGDALTFATGLDWAENYENQSYQSSSVLAMLYGEGHRDNVDFIVNHARRDEPGQTFSYSTGDAVLLAALVGAALEPSYGEAWPWVVLFDRIGMHNTAFERDSKGVYAGGSFVVASVRDYARFGYLYLNDGCWEGERVLPPGWVAASTRPSEAFKKKRIDAQGTWVAGRMWWLNVAVPEQNVEQPWPDAPADTFVASGHWGQEIVVIPSLDLVIVRIADDRDGSFELNTLIKLGVEVAR